MMSMTRLSTHLLALAASLALAATATAQAPGPGAARGFVHPGVVVHGGAPARYPAMRKARTVNVWVPGHEVERTRRVWVPGRTHQEWLPPLYETRYDACGRPITFCVRPGHWRTVCEPGHYETRLERVWVPGRWERRPC